MSALQNLLGNIQTGASSSGSRPPQFGGSSFSSTTSAYAGEELSAYYNDRFTFDGVLLVLLKIADTMKITFFLKCPLLEAVRKVTQELKKYENGLHSQRETILSRASVIATTDFFGLRYTREVTDFGYLINDRIRKYFDALCEDFTNDEKKSNEKEKNDLKEIFKFLADIRIYDRPDTAKGSINFDISVNKQKFGDERGGNGEKEKSEDDKQSQKEAKRNRKVDQTPTPPLPPPAPRPSKPEETTSTEQTQQTSKLPQTSKPPQASKPQQAPQTPKPPQVPDLTRSGQNPRQINVGDITFGLGSAKGNSDTSGLNLARDLAKAEAEAKAKAEDDKKDD